MLHHLSKWTAARFTDSLYRPLEPNTIRLVSFLPRSTPGDIHLAMYHFEKYMGQDDLAASNTPTDKTGNKAPTRLTPNPGVTYTALSYCWGNPTVTEPIYVNGRLVEITLNLWLALNSILQHHHLSQHFWIDALCLNQTDVSELNHQVHQMWRIYSEAVQIFAWIGPEGETTARAYKALKSAMSKCLRNTTGKCKCQPHDVYELYRAKEEIFALLNNDYFGRTWIKAEFTQARKIEILCGVLRVNSMSLEHAVTLLHAIEIPRAFFWLEIRIWESGVFHHYLPDAPKLIDRLILEFCESECRQPQDKVFAMLGQAEIRRLDPGGSLKPDYSLPMDALLMVVLEWLPRLFRDENRHGWETIAYEYGIEFSRALGVEAPEDWSEEQFCSWALTHKGWDTSDMPNSMVVGRGRRVDCTGEVLRILFKDWKEFAGHGKSWRNRILKFVRGGVKGTA